MQIVKERNLKVIPVINKVDLPIARVPETKEQMIKAFGLNPEHIIEISAKEGINIDKVLEEIILKVPPPDGKPDEPLRALIFSSMFDTHRGVVVFTRIVDGSINQSLLSQPSLQFMANGMGFSPIEVGYFTPQMSVGTSLETGEVGYIATGLKDIHLAQVGDTITFNPIFTEGKTATNVLP